MNDQQHEASAAEVGAIEESRTAAPGDACGAASGDERDEAGEDGPCQALSEAHREALRGHWLGQGLPAELAWLLQPEASATAAQRAVCEEALRFVRGLSASFDRHARRMVLAGVSTAVARLIEAMHGESVETSRRAAADLMRYWDRAARGEAADGARSEAAEGRHLADTLTDEQVEQIWSTLADARAAAGDEPMPLDAAADDGADAAADDDRIDEDDAEERCEGNDDDGA